MIIRMDIVWGKCVMKIQKATSARTAAAFVLMLVHAIESFKSTDASDPVGLLHISSVSVTFKPGTEARGATTLIIPNAGSCRSTEDGKRLFVYVLPFLKDMYMHAPYLQSGFRKRPPSGVCALRICKELMYKPITRLDTHGELRP